MKFRAIKVRPYAANRWGFDYHSLGQRKRVRCLSKKEAQDRAIEISVLLENGRPDLLGIDPIKLQQFLKWQAATEKSPSLADAREEFMRVKGTRSSRQVQSLKSDLEIFENFIGSSQRLATIMALDIQKFLDSRNVGECRKHNLRGTIVAMFRWARRMSYLDCERITEAEKVEPIPIVAGKASILLPDQMRTLIENVSDKFLPWLLIGGFAGIRSGEIIPGTQSKKEPLCWEDFDWKHEIIIVRAETAKTREEREVPLLPNLAQWLAPWRNAKGPVITCAVLPSRRETGRLGNLLVGGWKNNYLRDSFCSYRTRITQNVPQTSYEMGNSITMVKRSYHRRQSIDTAKEWFDIRPTTKKSNVVTFPMEPTEKRTVTGQKCAKKMAQTTQNLGPSFEDLAT